MNRPDHYKNTEKYYERVGNVWGIYTSDNYSIESFKYDSDSNLHIDEIAKRAKIQDGNVVLDCGCGFGKVISELQKRFPSNAFSGITLNQCHVDRKQHENVSVGNFEELKNAPESVDVILFIESFNHAFDKDCVLKECFRTLKKGGTLFILDQCITEKLFSSTLHNKVFREFYKNHAEFYGAKPISPNYIIQKAKQVGFTLESCIENVPNYVVNIQNETLKKVIIVEFLDTIYSELIFTK